MIDSDDLFRQRGQYSFIIALPKLYGAKSIQDLKDNVGTVKGTGLVRTLLSALRSRKHLLMYGKAKITFADAVTYNPTDDGQIELSDFSGSIVLPPYNRVLYEKNIEVESLNPGDTIRRAILLHHEGLRKTYVGYLKKIAGRSIPQGGLFI